MKEAPKIEAIAAYAALLAVDARRYSEKPDRKTRAKLITRAVVLFTGCRRAGLISQPAKGSA